MLAKCTSPAGPVCSVTPLQGHRSWSPNSHSGNISAKAARPLATFSSPTSPWQRSSEGTLSTVRKPKDCHVPTAPAFLCPSFLFHFFPVSFPIPVCTRSSSVLSHRPSRDLRPISPSAEGMVKCVSRGITLEGPGRSSMPANPAHFPEINTFTSL